MQVIIRRADEEDIPSIREIVLNSDEYHHTLQPERFRPVETIAYSDHFFQGLMRGEETELLVATQDGIIVGFISLQAKQREVPAFQCPDCVYVEDLVVHPDYRSLGIGKQLMMRAVEWGKERGLNALELDVQKGNDRAERFYLLLGLRPVATRMFVQI